MPASAAAPLGRPWLHLRKTDSTNERARELALAGAPHGTLVTADEQTAGRGRQGRSWLAAPGSALLCSLVLHRPSPLVSLAAGVAVCDVVGEPALVKWPNDVVLEREARLVKLAGILVEGRPQEGWAVLGIGLNVALDVSELPPAVGERAASMNRTSEDVRPLLGELLVALSERLSGDRAHVLDAWRKRDALRGREISWRPSHTSQDRSSVGRAEGIDDDGRLLVRVAEEDEPLALNAGEVHLLNSPGVAT